MKVPSSTTLKKYGLYEQDWLKMYYKFGGRCHVCLRLPSPKATRALHVDHEHIPNWKNLPPEERKQHVRGLACYTCNRFRLTRGTTRKTAKNLYRYLERYENIKCKHFS